MIAIVNTNGNERCTYEVRINNDVITSFTHNRSEGLAACLRKAATAVEVREWEDVKIIMDALK